MLRLRQSCCSNGGRGGIDIGWQSSAGASRERGAVGAGLALDLGLVVDVALVRVAVPEHGVLALVVRNCDPLVALVAKTLHVVLLHLTSLYGVREKFARNRRNAMIELLVVPIRRNSETNYELAQEDKNRRDSVCLHVSRAYQKALFLSWSHLPGEHVSQNPSLAWPVLRTHWGVYWSPSNRSFCFLAVRSPWISEPSKSPVSSPE